MVFRVFLLALYPCRVHSFPCGVEAVEGVLFLLFLFFPLFVGGSDVVKLLFACLPGCGD